MFFSGHPVYYAIGLFLKHDQEAKPYEYGLKTSGKVWLISESLCQLNGILWQALGLFSAHAIMPIVTFSWYDQHIISVQSHNTWEEVVEYRRSRSPPPHNVAISESMPYSRVNLTLENGKLHFHEYSRHWPEWYSEAISGLDARNWVIGLDYKDPRSGC